MGPVLVNKRPSKGKVDGRTMLEKAQERKMIANLEKAKCKSKSTNSFVALCTSDVIRISRDVGISLGPGIESANGYVDEILNSIDVRSNTFGESCPSCHTTDDSGARVSQKNGDVKGGVAPSTPTDQTIIPQVDGDDRDRGQWTQVVDKKESKSRRPNERGILEC
jgi:hypothetical protein